MMRACRWLLACMVGAAAFVASADGVHGVVLDGHTGHPLPGATVTAAGKVWPVDAAGQFWVDAAAGPILARAPGYWARREDPSDGEAQVTLALTPVRPRAVYLSVHGLANASIRSAALRLEAKGVINALVIDFKGDRGQTPYESAVRAAAGVGPYVDRAPVVPDLKSWLTAWHDKGIYLIARLVIFKDDPLASAHPEWGVRRLDGGAWRDNEQSQWIDPSNRQAWSHYLDLIEEVAGLGVDEIQLDYVRFPDASGLIFAEPNHRANRVESIRSFLQSAHERLVPYNTFLAADIFGYVCWNQNDTGIGQQLEEFGSVVDYISPMLYPSGFTWGIGGLRRPMDDPGQIVRRSLARARARTGLSPVRFRPWLQGFRDYAFDRRVLRQEDILSQIQAADVEGSDGWMLWNPRNQYGGLDAMEAAGGDPAGPP